LSSSACWRAITSRARAGMWRLFPARSYSSVRSDLVRERVRIASKLATKNRKHRPLVKR
jgi:hypothetical protein